MAQWKIKAGNTRHQIVRRSNHFNYKRLGSKITRVKRLKTLPFTAIDGSETKKKNGQKRGSRGARKKIHKRKKDTSHCKGV